MIIIRMFTMITSVETVSEGQISEPTTAQYRTVPLRPYNVTFDPLSIGVVLIMIIMLQLSWFTILIIIVLILIYNKGPTTFLCAGGVQLMCQSLTDTRLTEKLNEDGGDDCDGDYDENCDENCDCDFDGSSIKMMMN